MVDKRDSVIEMHYRELTDFFICSQRESNDLPELLQILCLRTLVEYRFEGMVLCSLDKDGILRPQASFGMNLSTINFPIDGFSIHDSNPCADAIKAQSPIFIDNLANPPAPYRRLVELNIPSIFKGLVSIPLQTQSRVVGSILAFTLRPKIRNDHLISLLGAIGWALGERLTAQKHINLVPMPKLISDVTQVVHHNGQKELTERQLLILQMIADGRTNGDIADLLGYSESLIRQETIRIYAALGCTGRSEATQIYQRIYASKISETEGGPAKQSTSPTRQIS